MKESFVFYETWAEAIRQMPDKSRFPVVSLVPNESEANVLKVKKAFEPIDIKELKQ